ncbi:unnamed protein product [Triticum aestivum]|uniref:Uncharacterized protein n=2 Tax=Triticum aestivum TaxID=4565 RepID=A0A9R1EM35_WHEAT|nr:hypothetical protein CFC21_027173 [Triticum aestivum]SPT15606.1 unnamed protein product [Triticum aestivum]
MNAGGVWAINPHRPVAGKRNASKFPPSPTATSEPLLRRAEAMADWRMKMERAIVELASGDEAKLARAREVVSWFATRREMRRAAKRVFRNLTVEEDERLAPNGFTTPTGAPVSALAALVWAMEEIESGDPSQRAKWWGFRSRRRHPAGPEEFVVGAVMAIPTPRTRWVPIPIEDSEEELDSEMEELEQIPDLGESSGGGKKKEKVLLPRRSPRFLRRSPGLLNLSKPPAM